LLVLLEHEAQEYPEYCVDDDGLLMMKMSMMNQAYVEN
jgi:hypothetical protein